MTGVIPERYVRPSTLIDELGREIHGNAWTGRELPLAPERPKRPSPLPKPEEWEDLGYLSEEQCRADIAAFEPEYKEEVAEYQRQLQTYEQARTEHLRHRTAVLRLLGELAAGRWVGAVLDGASGKILGPIETIFWRRDNAEQYLRSGAAPVNWSKPPSSNPRYSPPMGRLLLRRPTPSQEDPVGRDRQTSPSSHDAREGSLGEPPWRPKKGMTQSSWCHKDGPAEAEARRRLGALGTRATEAAICRTLTEMWRDAGLTCSDDSFAALRRRARSKRGTS